jgi:hypothetical protein
VKIGTLCVYHNGKREGDWPCHHSANMSMEGPPDDMKLVSIRLRCEKCKTLGKAEVRPDWTETTSGPPSGAVGWIPPIDGKAKAPDV